MKLKIVKSKPILKLKTIIKLPDTTLKAQYANETLTLLNSVKVNGESLVIDNE